MDKSHKHSVEQDTKSKSKLYDSIYIKLKNWPCYLVVLEVRAEVPAGKRGSSEGKIKFNFGIWVGACYTDVLICENSPIPILSTCAFVSVYFTLKEKIYKNDSLGNVLRPKKKIDDPAESSYK